MSLICKLFGACSPASCRSRRHSICGRSGSSLDGMPLVGSLRDLDVDGSLYNTRPARLVRCRGYSPPVRTSSVAW